MKIESTLWFVIPAQGRLEMSEVCLRQLRRTCDELPSLGVEASAVVVADDENLDIARGFGFATVERDNLFLGRKWNDGYQAAGAEGVDYVVPFGTDDWVLPGFLASWTLPGPWEVRCCRQTAVVSEDGRRMAKLVIPYEAGDGIRVFPTSLFRRFGYRPAQEDRKRAIDTSVWQTLCNKGRRRPTLVYHEYHSLQTVDFKSGGGRQLNSYEACQIYREGREIKRPFDVLEQIYPAESIREMEEVYMAARA